MTLNTHTSAPDPTTALPHIGPGDAPPSEARRSVLSGSLGLLLATLLWGCSFTWVKAAGAGINTASGAGAGSPVGPLTLLGARFLLAALLWASFHPRALAGWSARSVMNGSALGLALFVPMAFQVLGLDRTSEALSAFLTSLTIVFVPLTLALFLGRPPRRRMWIAVALAASGIWLMTGASPSGFGLGELLGLGCGLTFTAHILLIDGIMKRETLGRMTIAQFAFVGLASAVVVALVPGGRELFTASGAWRAVTFGNATIAATPAGILASDSVALNLLLVTLFSTLGAFTLQFAFQPRVTPAHAALLLLAEPVFAAIFAFAMLGHRLETSAIVGASLILGANVYATLRNAAAA